MSGGPGCWPVVGPVTPDREQFRALSAGGALVPVRRTILHDTLTPVGALLRIDDGAASFLVETPDDGVAVFGSRPELVFTARGDACTIHEGGHTRPGGGPPRAVLAALLRERGALDLPGLPAFCGGAVGWLGLGAARWWEPGLCPAPAADDAPEAVFLFTRVTCVQRDESIQVLTLAGAADDPDASWTEAVARIDEEIARLAGPPASRGTSSDPLRDHRGLRTMRRAFDLDVLAFARSGPHALGELGSGPWLRRRGDRVEARVGGRGCSRGRNETEDEEARERLAADDSARADHARRVDEARAELGWLAEPGSLETPQLFRIVERPGSRCLASLVRARLPRDMDSLDVAGARVGSALGIGTPAWRMWPFHAGTGWLPDASTPRVAATFDARGDFDLFALRLGFGRLYRPPWSSVLDLVTDEAPAREAGERP